jgi:hypothetical protein
MYVQYPKWTSKKDLEIELGFFGILKVIEEKGRTRTRICNSVVLALTFRYLLVYLASRM